MVRQREVHQRSVLHKARAESIIAASLQIPFRGPSFGLHHGSVQSQHKTHPFGAIRNVDQGLEHLKESDLNDRSLGVRQHMKRAPSTDSDTGWLSVLPFAENVRRLEARERPSITAPPVPQHGPPPHATSPDLLAAINALQAFTEQVRSPQIRPHSPLLRTVPSSY